MKGPLPAVRRKSGRWRACQRRERPDYSYVREAVDRLPEKLRTTVILYYFHGFSEKETAMALHIPPGTVKSRLHKAKRVLKEELSDANDLQF
ncbi:MAG: RNA polymerase sigma factor [Clostridia bacterium]